MVKDNLLIAEQDIRGEEEKTHISFNDERPFIGLERIMRDFSSNHSLTNNEQSQLQETLGRAQVAAKYLEVNKPSLYRRHEKTIKNVQQIIHEQEGTIEQRVVDEIVDDALRVQQEQLPKTIQTLVNKHELTKTKVGRVELYLPDMTPYYEEVHAQDEHNKDRVYVEFSWQTKGFLLWSLVLEEEKLVEREELFSTWEYDGVSKERAERLDEEHPELSTDAYIEQISERYLSMIQAQALTEFFKDKEPRIYQQMPKELVNDLNALYCLRQDIIDNPIGEVILRMQIKKNKALGVQLDEQHNNVMGAVQGLAESFGAAFKPTYIVDNELVLQDLDEREH